MNDYEFKVPRELIKKFYPHPEEYGDFVVDLENGMYTDIYCRDNGEFITITNDSKLINYLTKEFNFSNLILMGNINATYIAVGIASKILNILNPELYIIAARNLKDKTITGRYLFKENEIIFNEDWIKKSQWIEVVETAFKLTRNAYQDYSIKTNSNEPVKRLKVWKEEVNKNLIFSKSRKKMSDKKYLNQEIEIDAIAFAHGLIKKELSIDTFIPDIIKDQVIERLKEIEPHV